MSNTGTCSNCRALYKKCKYNYARQTHCTKEDCQCVRHRNNNTDYNRREREHLEEERLLREVQRAERLGLATSKKTQENPVSRDEFEQLNEVLESTRISLSGLLVLLQGFAAKMTSDEAHTQTVDFARSFLRECYDIGQSLFPALGKKLNLQDILYEKTNSSAGKAKNCTSKLQLAGSSLGP